MNAFELVSLLLEAEQPAASNRTGVYVFGPDLPSKGYNAPDMETLVNNFRRYGLVSHEADGEALITSLTQMGYTFFLKKGPTEIEVIGPIPAQTTSEGEKRAAQYLGLDKHEKVQYRSTPTGNSQEMLVDYVLFGSKELERDEREKKKEAKAQRSVPTKEFGLVDPEEEEFFNPATGKAVNLPDHPLGYSDSHEADFKPLGAPASIGIVYDQGSKEGIIIREVIPGGPAAQAGLLAGEVIVQGLYVNKYGLAKGPFYVYNDDHLRKLLSRAAIKYPIRLRVVRGHGDTEWVPIMAVPKLQQQSGPEMHIPAQEVQASASKPRKPRKPPTKPAAVQKSFARKLFRPNEPTPASETGNNPPNVSSLT